MRSIFFLIALMSLSGPLLAHSLADGESLARQIEHQVLGTHHAPAILFIVLLATVVAGATLRNNQAARHDRSTQRKRSD